MESSTNTLNVKTFARDKENKIISYWKDAVESIDLFWFEKPKVCIEYKQGSLQPKWYADGEINACFNCLDFHVNAGLDEQAAVIHVDGQGREVGRLSYQMLLEKVRKFAGLLSSYNIHKGDRALVFMPDIPQAVVAILGCARIGVVHVVVFASLTMTELAKRIAHIKPKVIITASCRVTHGLAVPLKSIVDAAMKIAAYEPHKVIVYQRKQSKASLDLQRDIHWQNAIERVQPADCRKLKATDVLYILYTSGTTGSLKGIMKDHGGHTVAAKWFMREVMGLKTGERFFTAVSMGGLPCLSLTIYGVLLNGATAIMVEEQMPLKLDPSILLRILNHFDVALAFTAVCTIRMMKSSAHSSSDEVHVPLQKTRAIYIGGECIEKDLIQWAMKYLGVPVLNQWGQTETSIAAFSFSTELNILPSVCNAISSGRILPGWAFKIVKNDLEECKIGESGTLLLQLPLPPGTLVGVYDDEERFKQYFTKYEGFYDTGDVATMDANGFVTIHGRADFLINVASLKISPSHVENVISRHPKVIDQCIVAEKDNLMGFVLLGFIVLQTGLSKDEFIIVAREVKEMVHETLGNHVCLKRLIQVSKLPKLNTGKIQRQLLQSIVNNQKGLKVSDDLTDIANEVRSLLAQDFKGSCS